MSEAVPLRPHTHGRLFFTLSQAPKLRILRVTVEIFLKRLFCRFQLWESELSYCPEKRGGRGEY